MEIKYGGRYIRIEDDWDAIRLLKCSCSHRLSEHYFHNLEGSADWIEVGACKTCGNCRQFRIIKARNRNYSYA